MISKNLTRRLQKRVIFKFNDDTTHYLCSTYTAWQWYYNPQFIDIYPTTCKIFWILHDESQFFYSSLVCDLIRTCTNHYYVSKQHIYFNQFSFISQMCHILLAFLLQYFKSLKALTNRLYKKGE